MKEEQGQFLGNNFHCCDISLFKHSPGTVPPSTLIASPSNDGHDYETQDDWGESPPHEYYSNYPSEHDKIGSSEDDDDDDDDEDDPHYEPVR